MYSSGKKSTSAKRRPVDGSINEKVEEAKENKDGKPTVGEMRLYSFGTNCNVMTVSERCCVPNVTRLKRVKNAFSYKLINLFVFQTCQGQPTIHSCLNLNKPLRNNPLTLILDENTATDRLPKDTSKQSEGFCLNRNNDILYLSFYFTQTVFSRVVLLLLLASSFA